MAGKQRANALVVASVRWRNQLYIVLCTQFGNVVNGPLPSGIVPHLLQQ